MSEYKNDKRLARKVVDGVEQEEYISFRALKKGDIFLLYELDNDDVAKLVNNKKALALTDPYIIDNNKIGFEEGKVPTYEIYGINADFIND